MSRYAFDVFTRKAPFVSLPINIICRKRSGNKIKADCGEQYLTTIEANSYDDAISKLTNKIRMLSTKD